MWYDNKDITDQTHIHVQADGWNIYCSRRVVDNVMCWQCRSSIHGTDASWAYRRRNLWRFICPIWIIHSKSLMNISRHTPSCLQHRERTSKLSYSGARDPATTALPVGQISNLICCYYKLMKTFRQTQRPLQGAKPDKFKEATTKWEDWKPMGLFQVLMGFRLNTLW